MKTQLFLSVVMVITMLSCSKPASSSKTGDPTEDLVWLKARKQELSANCTCIPSIWQASYEGKTIYEVGCAGPACLCVHFYYDENGKAVVGSEEGNRTAFLAKVTGRKELWSCK